MLLAIPATSAASDIAPLVLFKKFMSPAVVEACSEKNGTSPSASVSYHDASDTAPPPDPPEADAASSPPLAFLPAPRAPPVSFPSFEAPSNPVTRFS